MRTKEGTLHIVWLNRGQTPLSKYSIGFADYSSGGGAMKSIQVNSEPGLRDFLLRVGIHESVVASVFLNLRNDGQASILRVVLTDEQLRALGLQGPPGTAKEKVESAITMLKSQGHTVTPVIRANGTMWFQIDSAMLTSWEEMVNLADGVYSLDVLVELYRNRLSVRFNVFDEPAGPVLSYSVAGHFTSATFSLAGGARYSTKVALIRALNEVGLNGFEIANAGAPTKTYTVTKAQLVQLGLKLPEG